MENSFFEKLIKLIQEKMGEAYRIEMTLVTKNNGIELDGIAILKEGERYTPAIYINDFYEEYKHGVSCQKIASQIIDMYYSAKKLETSNEPLSFAYEDMKDKIIYRLVNYEKNEKILEQIPFIRFLDLAITFHYLINKNNASTSTIRITKEMMELWKIDVNSIWEQAKANTPRYFPISIRTMSQVLWETLEKEVPEALFSKTEESSMGQNMYILSNESGFNGSAALLYENGISKFAMEHCCNFYILPSSIHEVILVPFRDTYIKNELCEMVREINQTQVPAQEVLSDNVYFYDYQNNFFEL